MRSLRVAAALCFLGLATAPALAAPQPVKAAVLRSTGTVYLNQTIWPELNAGWSQFGDVPVQIDYTSLAGYNWTVEDIAATGADVLVLSNPAFWPYDGAEIDAVRQYVEAGHGLIISYGKFRSADRALAPLVGLSASNVLGTVTTTDPIELEALFPEHPLFNGLTAPYVSGVRFRARPWFPGDPWILDGGTVLANLYTRVIPPGPGIIAKETKAYRGLYFSYYIEDKDGGANLQDMQVFYNALVWAGTPEPASFMLLGVGSGALLRRRRRRWFA